MTVYESIFLFLVLIAQPINRNIHKKQEKNEYYRKTFRIELISIVLTDLISQC